MADLFKTAATWLSGQMATHFASDVTYGRASGSSSSEVVIRATKGRSVVDVDDNGVRTQVETTDWLILVDRLELDGLPVTPAVGDKVTEEDGTVYEVMDLPGEGAWRYSDLHRTTYRIHSRLITEATE